VRLGRRLAVEVSRETTLTPFAFWGSAITKPRFLVGSATHLPAEEAVGVPTRALRLVAVEAHARRRAVGS